MEIMNKFIVAKGKYLRVINNKNGAVKFMVQTKGDVRRDCKKCRNLNHLILLIIPIHFSVCPFHYVQVITDHLRK